MVGVCWAKALHMIGGTHPESVAMLTLAIIAVLTESFAHVHRRILNGEFTCTTCQ